VPTLRGAWERGEKVVKCIGFDATEDHRTYAASAGMSICPEPGLPGYSDRYEMRYPLREWGFDRVKCGQIIVDAGLPLPPKSACFFCPSMKEAEIVQLAEDEPDLYRLALEMQRRYRDGRHFRGDNAFTISAVRPDTGEKVTQILYGQDVAAVRAQFRMIYDDTVEPFRYRIRVHSAVVGLGRGKVWPDRFSLPVIGAT